ncbi:hypothetical protein IFM89_004004 [Coptis chinensis]|uniref:Uncharacterized protein n=1 Tax=Coptis chinensis TaxID=261450 RepID=A0A835LHH9_9MAGN|nr:hypothetical protein IFM89_004004 [Coptis chinensis]
MHHKNKGIPTLITWTFGGNTRCRPRILGQLDIKRSRGPLHSPRCFHPYISRQFLLWTAKCRYIPDLPCIADDTGLVDNLLDVHGKSLRVKISLGDSSINYFSIKLLVTGCQDYVLENFEGIAEFEPPPSPDSSYGHTFPGDEDFAKRAGRCSTPVTPHATFGTHSTKETTSIDTNQAASSPGNLSSSDEPPSPNTDGSHSIPILPKGSIFAKPDWNVFGAITTALASVGHTLQGGSVELVLHPLRLAFETKNLKLPEPAP